MQGAEREATWFDRACGAVAFFVPFGIALVHATSRPAWREDLTLLRGLAWVGNGTTGGVTALLVQAFFFVPLGSVHLRAGLAAALALGAAGWALYRLAHLVLDFDADTPRLAPALAALAAVAPTTGATGQQEGTIAGGASVALLLASLAVLESYDRPFERPRSALVLGLLLGALGSENGIVAFVVALGVAVSLVVSRRTFSRAPALSALVGAAAAASFLLAPLYVRPSAPSPFLDLGRSIAALGPVVPAGGLLPFGGAGALGEELGRVALVAAFAGAVIGLLRARLRAAVLPLVAVVAIDLLVASRGISNDIAFPLHFVALAFTSVGAAIALHALAVTLLDMRLVLAREATLLLVMGDLALTAASAEEASFASDRSGWTGAEAFTDEAIERLAPGAAVLVRSRAAAHRFWASRLVEGTRPDVLVVPSPILGDTRIALGLLRAEPALQPALRDISLEGRAGEGALTVLADARPTLVELDSHWDRRVGSHLVADHFWLRFAPQPLGPSDRKAAFADLRNRFTRVLVASTVDEHVEPSTAAMLRARLADGAANAAMLGDRDEAVSLLESLGKVSPGDSFAGELARRLAAAKSGAIDIKGLLP